MTDDARDALESLANHGTQHGAQAVFRRAQEMAQGGSVVSLSDAARHSRRRTVLGATTALAVAAALAAGILLVGNGSDSPTRSVNAAAPVSTSADPSSTQPAPSTSTASTTQPAPSTTSAQTPKYLVTPLGIGDARFGMTLAEASKALGVEIMQNPVQVLCADLRSTSARTVLGTDKDRLTWVGTWSPDVATEAGIHVGSTMQAAQAAYPTSTRVPQTNGPLALVAKDDQGNLFKFYDGATTAKRDVPNATVLYMEVVPATTVSAGSPTTCD